MVKPHVRKIESPEGVQTADDSIAEKSYTIEPIYKCIQR